MLKLHQNILQNLRNRSPPLHTDRKEQQKDKVTSWEKIGRKN